jgi:hypothetical protein
MQRFLKIPKEASSRHLDPAARARFERHTVNGLDRQRDAGQGDAAEAGNGQLFHMHLHWEASEVLVRLCWRSALTLLFLHGNLL